MFNQLAGQCLVPPIAGAGLAINQIGATVVPHNNAAFQPSQIPPDAVAQTPDGDDDGAIVQSWTGAKVSDLIRAPALRRRYERWMTLVKNKTPRLNEMLGADPTSELNDAMLLLRVPDDFTFVYHGVAAVKLIGANLTGQLMSTRVTATARGVAKVFEKSAAVREPYYVRHLSAVSSTQHFLIEQLVLPVAADERRQVQFILAYNAPLDDKSEVLSAIFERSQVGMIAATSNHDDTGRLQNGRILLINAAARKILRLPDSAAALQTVRDLGPWFRDGALWTKKNVVTADKQTHIHYLEQSSGKNYRVTVEPVQNFVLFSIVDMAGLQ